MSNNIPSHWKTFTLGDLFLIQRGGSPRPINKYLTADDNGINWIKIGDAKPGSKYITETKEKITPDGLSKTRMVEEGDFILSNSMSFGRPYIMKTKGCIHDGWLLLKEKEDNILIKDYVYYILSSPEVYNQFKNSVAGGVVSNLNIERVSKVVIPIPPTLEEQEEIVKILDDAADMVRLRRECINHTVDLIPAIFYQMFGDSENNIKQLPLHKIKEFAKINPSKPKFDDLSKDISFLAMKDISETGQIIGGEIRPISEVNKGFTCFKENDVLLAKITPCFENGKGTIARGLTNGIGFGSTEFHVLRPNNDEILPEYLFYLLHTDHFKTLGKMNMKGAAGQKRVPKDFIENYSFPKPSLSQQEEFAKIVSEIDEYKRQQYQELKYAEDLFQSLLQKAFTGELTASKYGN